MNVHVFVVSGVGTSFVCDIAIDSFDRILFSFSIPDRAEIAPAIELITKTINISMHHVPLVLPIIFPTLQSRNGSDI
jgi:hypothetical protein